MSAGNKEKRKLYNADYRQRNRLACQKYKKKLAAWFREIKEQLSCIRCGESRYYCLSFHHRDPKEKEQDITRMLYRCSKEKILEEIKKCDVLCHNCHAAFHWEEINECG